MGNLVWTSGINETISNNLEFAKEISKAIQKYKNHDWGDLCESDKQMNIDAIKSGNDRIFAVYNTSEGEIYIITEWDRSVTTILFADEY